MIRNRNIVCIASNWHDHPTSKHHVMRLLAEHNHVLWVNFHASRKPSLSRGDAGVIARRLRQVFRGVQHAAPNLDVLSPLLLPWPESPIARFANGIALCRQVQRALRRLPCRPTQLWLFTPDVPEIIPRIRAERVVYYCVDDFAAFDGFNTELIERLESQTMARSDVVVTTSQQLYDDRRNRHAAVHMVPHGVDYDHFAQATTLDDDAIPDDIRRIRGPILGFMGLISDYVDLPLIAQAAERRPNWSFVLIGDTRCDTGIVASLPNVHLVGGRPYASLPAYCRAFDVGLIPFRMNRLVRAVNPIKLREYLAAGLPVVSAPMNAVMPYTPHVQIADEVEPFLAACDRAIEMANNTAPSKRQQIVRSEGWRARVELLCSIVENRPKTGENAHSPQTAQPCTPSCASCSCVAPAAKSVSTTE